MHCRSLTDDGVVPSSLVHEQKRRIANPSVRTVPVCIDVGPYLPRIGGHLVDDTCMCGSALVTFATSASIDMDARVMAQDCDCSLHGCLGCGASCK